MHVLRYGTTILRHLHDSRAQPGYSRPAAMRMRYTAIPCPYRTSYVILDAEYSELYFTEDREGYEEVSDGAKDVSVAWDIRCCTLGIYIAWLCISLQLPLS